MALVTHQIQGSYSTFPSRPQQWIGGMELKRFVTTLHMVVRTDWFLSLKCKSCLSVGGPLVRGRKGKSLRISAFKGGAQNDELGGKSSRSKSTKNSVKLSYIPHESEETLTESPKVQDGPLSYASEADERIAGSVAIQNLFKNWLTLLRSQSPNQVVDEILEGPDPREISEIQNGTQKKERGEVLRTVWCYFMGLDATIKIPLMIFIPWYLAVNVVYGAEVSKELNPLWVLGPLIVVLYIKMLRGLCALYVFSFKQTVKVVKNLPTYYLLAYNYITRGKLKEVIQAYFWQPVVDIKNLDYKELSKRKVKDLKVWAVEKYLDFVESIWPYYCRIIRFLKRANLI
ncbi:hypothetical protein F0562_024282 [Nyssa sinensis]|uniref:Uncharacterized protein n=1 Tax=Nyssa sinensis TaxID=561372 RepID=A0A5J5BDM5_9ASTE|nr:hypothetical protein F0562_024282 [Nyssa sinensis]